jgi:subtilisin-like proprotein convertase family protein
MNKRRAIFIMFAALALLLVSMVLSQSAIGGVKASQTKDQGEFRFLQSITNFSINDIFKLFLPLVSYSLPTPTPTETPTPTPTNTPTITPTATQPSVQPFTQCRTADLTILDEGFAVDGMTVTKSGRIQSMKVYLDVSHTFVNDLVFTLEQKSTSKKITLINRPTTPPPFELVCTGNDIDVTLDDNASTAVDLSCNNNVVPAISGVKRPYMLLLVYNGEQMSGQWEMVARDERAGDSGVLNRWCLEFQFTP